MEESDAETMLAYLPKERLPRARRFFARDSTAACKERVAALRRRFKFLDGVRLPLNDIGWLRGYISAAPVPFLA